jgi:hypothetical protein
MLPDIHKSLEPFLDHLLEASARLWRHIIIIILQRAVWISRSAYLFHSDRIASYNDGEFFFLEL